jgi:hypothetical protein
MTENMHLGVKYVDHYYSRAAFGGLTSCYWNVNRDIITRGFTTPQEHPARDESPSKPSKKS